MTPLKCDGCRACCEGDTITLLPGDDPSQYKTKLEDGKRVLAKGKDGNCVYLGKRGCEIHSRAPQMCKAFDCRKWALIVRDMPAPKREALMGITKRARTIAAGEKRLAEMGA